MKLGFDQFKRYIEHITATREFEQEMINAMSKYNARTSDAIDVWLPTIMESDLVDLLSDVLDDEETLAYWIYDLDCGKEYRDGCIVDDNDQPIPCRTIEELWAALQKK